MTANDAIYIAAALYGIGLLVLCFVTIRLLRDKIHRPVGGALITLAWFVAATFLATFASVIFWEY